MKFRARNSYGAPKYQRGCGSKTIWLGNIIDPWQVSIKIPLPQGRHIGAVRWRSIFLTIRDIMKGSGKQNMGT